MRLSVGKDAADASARRLCKEAELNAVNHGVGVVPENGNGHRSLSTTVAEYLEETKLSKKPKTTAAYSTALAYFVESCHKINLADVDRKDLLKFAAFLRDEKGQVQRLEDLSEAGEKPKGKKCKGMDGLIPSRFDDFKPFPEQYSTLMRTYSPSFAEGGQGRSYHGVGHWVTECPT